MRNAESIIKLSICILIYTTACISEKSGKIRNGDIVFRANTESDLSKAINDVTQTQEKFNYTHIGICEVVNNEVYVYHASSNRGVCKDLLSEFCQPIKNSYFIVDLYRINDFNEEQIDRAITKADALLDKSYNETYILEDEGYYCSEYIYELFKTDSVFTLEPMTFKESVTNNFHPVWVDYYSKLGIAIPEGQLGCNPNGMANNKNITLIKNIYTSE